MADEKEVGGGGDLGGSGSGALHEFIRRSGSGSAVMSLRELEALDLDHYDFINAPQYVDFSDMAAVDDPNADEFFETHREDDDVMIPIENISPTIQLLANQGKIRLSEPFREESRTVLKSVENTCHPIIMDQDAEAVKEGDIVKMSDISLMSAEQVQEEKDTVQVLPITPSSELLAQLEQLQILSSEEEEDEIRNDEEDKENYITPTKSIPTDDTMVDAILKTPGSRLPIPVKSYIPQEVVVQVQPPVIKMKPKPVVKEVRKIQPQASTIKNCQPVATRGPLKAPHYVSLAEAVTKFQKNTPDRFRTLPKGKVPILRSRSVDARTPTPDAYRHDTPALGTHASSKAYYDTGNRNHFASISSSSSNTAAKPVDEVASVAKPRATIPQPFHFAISKNRPKPEDKVPEYQFKARPAPRMNGTVRIPQKPLPTVTMPVAPHFASDDRIRERHAKKAQSATQSPTASHALRNTFRRTPISKEFDGQYGNMPSLHTEKRAVEREEFDKTIRQKELEEQKRRQEEQSRIEEEQRRQDAELRRQLVHKAQPFKPLKPFLLKPNVRPLTIPHSPAFNALPSQRRMTTTTTPTKSKRTINSSM